MRRIALLVAFMILQAVPSVHAAALREVQELGDVFSPGPRTVGVSDAWALFNNPAGLALVEEAELVGGYAYRLNLGQQGLHQGQAGLALSPFKNFVIGAGLQLALPQTQDGDDKGALSGSFAAALRIGDSIAIGARATKQRQYANLEADPFRFSLGLECFLFSWLSVGGNISPVFEDITKKPEFRAGIAVIPVSDHLVISAESQFLPNDDSNSRAYKIFPELGAKLTLGAFTLLASARASELERPWAKPTIFAGVELNFDHLGVGLVSQGQTTNTIDTGARFKLISQPSTKELL